MSFHIFKETITPVAKTINVRNIIDSDGPHLMTFGARTVVADAAAGSYRMRLTYETDNGELINQFSTWTVASSVAQIDGAIWYQPAIVLLDKRHPLGDGLLADPYGVLTLSVETSGGSFGAAQMTYEGIFITFDGGSSVVYHP